MINIIRQASLNDIDSLMEIFEIARCFMKRTGNPHQWINGYPQRDFLLEEINQGHCMVCLNESNKIIATFCFIQGPDPTYSRIEEGEWISDEPYYVLHRLASDASCHGIADACISWCKQHHTGLRADTHSDNLIMQHLLEKHGFQRCGIIHVLNGTPRIAYQYVSQTGNKEFGS